MSTHRTLNEARALAAARNRQWQMREEARKAHEAALMQWRRLPLLARWMAQRAR